ncbi:MAG: hypothetical protein OXP75_10665 [Rhodospirillales bacterium]|nr:hypothetical protein [Rhodospirillales bacterium]
MTTHELPDEPVFAFTPAYELPDQPQQIRIVFEGMDGYIPTALVALTLADAERLCDRLNRRMGLDREAWSAIVGRSMAAGRGDAPLH